MIFPHYFQVDENCQLQNSLEAHNPQTKTPTRYPMVAQMEGLWHAL